jgi:hypothetical protein
VDGPDFVRQFNADESGPSKGSSKDGAKCRKQLTELILKTFQIEFLKSCILLDEHSYSHDDQTSGGWASLTREYNAGFLP